MKKLAGLWAALFLAAYLGSIMLYASSGLGRTHVIASTSGLDDGTKVTMDIEDIQTASSTLVANLSVAPGADLLDPKTRYLKDDLTVVVTSVVAASKRTWLRGTLPDVFRVSLTLTGEPAAWPLDTYRTGPVVVELLSGAERLDMQPAVECVDLLPGWKVGVSPISRHDARTRYEVDLSRSRSTIAFGAVILFVLVTLAGLGLFVAITTVGGRRPFQSPMTAWYAAMLFAVMPLRNALPGSPPFGSWIDVTIVLWVIVVLVLSMVLYIMSWWRQLKPIPDPVAGVASAGRP